MRVTRVVGAALLAAFSCLLVVLVASTAAAPVVEYVVNTTRDEPSEVHGGHECKTALGFCSLRAAIEVVNEEEEANNKISFDPTVFNGEEEDAVRVQTTSLPPIDFSTTIEAGTNCTTATIVSAPCAGVTGLNGEPVFVVDADNTTIKGLSISEGSVGIEVNESTGFKATGDWIGIEMSGSNALPASAGGILLGHGSDGAVIGGSAAGERNVIAFNEIGLDIEGASHTTVRGNWFGVNADGITPGRQETDIEVTNYKHSTDPEVKAEDNEIGGPLDTHAEETPECDGACNVISTAVEDGIDLSGHGAERPPASGPTEIRANYLGLDATGENAVNADDQPPFFEGNQGVGISADAAGEVTIGGSANEANYVVGARVGVSGENSGDFEAKGNVFGETLGGAESAPQSSGAILVVAAAGTEPPVIAKNRIRMGEEGVGIGERGGGSTIAANEIEGGEVGIFSEGSAALAGSLIEDNLVEDSEEDGIFVSNPDNEVFGNEIRHAGDMGIEVESPGVAVDGNVIGGDSSAEENAIFDSGGYAVMIHTTEDSRNEVRRNHGSGNEGDGGFIVLRPVEIVPDENDPNGIKHPTITAAGKTEASGKGVAGARVRVFRKESSEEGELAGFLGEGVVGSNGEWKVTFAAVPGETLVTATQTLDGGTSDLAETAKTPHDSPPLVCPEAGAIGCSTPSPVCPEAGASGCTSSPSPATQPAATVPKVTIKKGPKANSESTTAKFVFSSNEAGSKFQCKLDGKSFASCKSPKTYKKLKPGKHVFQVRAVGPTGLVDKTPAKRKFTVLR